MSKPGMCAGSPDVAPDVTLCDRRNTANAEMRYSEIVEQAAERRDQLGNRAPAARIVRELQGQKICARGHGFISTDLALAVADRRAARTERCHLNCFFPSYANDFRGREGAAPPGRTARVARNYPSLGIGEIATSDSSQLSLEFALSFRR